MPRHAHGLRFAHHVVAALCLLAIGVHAAAGTIAGTSTDAIDASLAATQTANLIIELPHAALRARRPGEIEAARHASHDQLDKIARDPALTHLRVNRVYGLINFAAVTADRSELAALQKSPDVGVIIVDAVNAPSLHNSVPAMSPSSYPSRLRRPPAGVEQWSVAVIDAGVALHAGFQGAVLDTAGACYSRSLEAGASGVCPQGSSGTGVGAATSCPNVAGVQMCRHGTHVAGIVASRQDYLGVDYEGVAPGALIIPVQVFHVCAAGGTCTCSGNSYPCDIAYDSDILAGMDYVASIASQHRIAAVNMSLGGGSYASYCDATSSAYVNALQGLANFNILTVIAAGNDGLNNAIGRPACFSGAVAVAALSPINDYYPFSYLALAGYSNDASIVKVIAPGSSIKSLCISPDLTPLCQMSGTSMAAPMVAGAIAAIRSRRPDASAAQVRTGLETIGTPVASLRNGFSFQQNLPSIIQIIAGIPMSPAQGKAMVKMLSIIEPEEFNDRVFANGFD